MKTEIEFLDKQLSTLRLEFYQQLNPPLTDTDIDSLEERYRMKIHADLRMLYKWKDGQADGNNESFVNNSEFLPLEIALDMAQENNSMKDDFPEENWWNEQWVPFLHNGGGDYICFDAAGVFTGKENQLIEFWHETGERNVIAPSLASFITALNTYLKNTPIDEFDEFFVVDDIKGFPKKFFTEGPPEN